MPPSIVDQTAPLPTDHFSRTLRAARDNPGTSYAESTVRAVDFYGNAESWIVTTFRHDGRETVFLERIAADGALRLVLPPEVTAVLGSHRERVILKVRRKAAQRALETRRERGDQIGNPEALAKARKAWRKAKR